MREIKSVERPTGEAPLTGIPGIQWCIALSLAAGIFLWAGPLMAQQTVGSVTGVKRAASVTHEGQDEIVLVRVGDSVLFMDTYETKARARAKLLFDDDSLLTLGQKTRLQITENVYNPAKNQRSTTMKVFSGRVRVLVGKIFSGTGSKFEIHTPTAVAAARGTYFIVWMMGSASNPTTGILTLEGLVEVRSPDPAISELVRLGPNEFTTVAKGGAPVKAAAIRSGLLAELLASTDVRDERNEIIPETLALPMTEDLSSPTTDLVSPGIAAQPASDEQIASEEGTITYEDSFISGDGSLSSSLPPIDQQPVTSVPPSGGGSTGGSTSVDVEISF